MRIPWLLTLALLRSQGALCDAPACSCRGRPTIAEARERATVVFLGRVTEVREDTMDFHGTGEQDRARAITLRVLAGWKGAVADTAVVRTGAGGGDCGYPFEQGLTYLVYATGPDGDWRTNICQRTTAAAQATRDLEALGVPVLDRRPRRPAPPR